MAKNKQKILSIVLAGGEGTRLMPLTRDRAKPAVPFGGVFRLIDFPLSNLVNSDYRHIIVLTQYKSHSLDRHISQMWRFSSLLGNYVSPVPAQQRLGKHWYLGSADAIYQTINIIEDVQPDIRGHRRRRTTSTAWTSARWSSSTSNRVRSSPWQASASRLRSPTSSA